MNVTRALAPTTGDVVVVGEKLVHLSLEHVGDDDAVCGHVGERGKTLFQISLCV
jgi:hypothetical protein